MLVPICNCTNFFATCTEMSFSFLTFLNCVQINLSYDYIFFQSVLLKYFFITLRFFPGILAHWRNITQSMLLIFSDLVHQINRKIFHTPWRHGLRYDKSDTFLPSYESGLSYLRLVLLIPNSLCTVNFRFLG